MFSNRAILLPHIEGFRMFCRWTCDFQEQARYVTNQQHLQMELRKGIILLYYMVEVELFSSHKNAWKGKKRDYRLWRRVASVTTEFAWLPPNIAWSFCSTALYRNETRLCYKFAESHLSLDGKNFEASI